MILDGAGEKAKIEDRKSRVASPGCVWHRFLDKVPGIEKDVIDEWPFAKGCSMPSKNSSSSLCWLLDDSDIAFTSGDLLAR